MQLSKSLLHRKRLAGFTLPAILVVVGALLILAVGILLVTGIERNTARSFADRERATLAARAGLDELKGILDKEAANDDFLIVQGTVPRDPKSTSKKESIPYLYLARGSGGGTSLSYRYLPLFSTATSPAAPAAGAAVLAAPKTTDLIGTAPKELATLPWYDPATVSWVPVTDANGKLVSRYAYWVEDLQGRADAGTAGNTKDGGAHKRYGWKPGDAAKFVDPKNNDKTILFPAPGLNAVASSEPANNVRDAEPPLDQVALYALDPAVVTKDNSNLDKTIIDGRKALVSPESVLAVAGTLPPLTRGVDGRLADTKGSALEQSLTASVRPYDEQPLVPFANGLDASVTGKPKLNLNDLLTKPASAAVDEMAAWIQKGLPQFESRKGGFPDDYLKTLAANAIDYADADSDGTVSTGVTAGANAYRGLDVYPLMSEVILHIKYNGSATVKGRTTLRWQFILFVELWNHTNLKAEGMARVSYENGMIKPPIGLGTAGGRFDSSALMDSTQVLSPKPEKIGNRYWSAPFAVELQPNEYFFYKAATIDYVMDMGPSSTTLQSKFFVDEDLGSSGISMMWNNREVDRTDKLVRGNSSPAAPQNEYTTKVPEQSGKANIPGHSYGPWNNKKPFPDYRNNMGDSRQALYLRGAAYPLSDNSYPGNVSPNRRNIRNATIYKDGKGQANVYGRVMPSEWPDGGHDAAVAGLSPPNVYPPDDNYDPTDLVKFPKYISPNEGDSPTFISNRGQFYSATELGRIFDPIMFIPKYDTSDHTATILTGNMPSGRVSWPSVEVNSTPDIYFGGGNTLRIGRPEHPDFDQPAKHAPVDMPGTHAARLLDLFHAGKSRSKTQAERAGPVVRIEGHINVNTATEDAIRAMSAGLLVTDPRLVKRTSEIHSTSTFAPPVSPLEVSTPTQSRQADVVAQAIIKSRPFASPSEIASVLDPGGKVLLGNRDLLPDGNKIQWSDLAAEELFGRIYESSTVRSRNFRVWVIGQSLAPTQVSNPSPEVMAESRKVFTVFADPGLRKSDGSIDTTKSRTKVINENDF